MYQHAIMPLNCAKINPLKEINFSMDKKTPSLKKLGVLQLSLCGLN